MSEYLSTLLPHVITYQEELIASIGETFQMVLIAGAFSVTLGLILGTILTVTDTGGLYENRWVFSVLDKIVNSIRSMPFVILIALLVTFTRWLVGTSLGIKGAIVPMVFGSVPFTTRMIYQSLIETDRGVIEAARAMGVSRLYIILHVIYPESRPGLIRALVTSIISLIGLSAMAGTVGGGGLGSFAIRYGYTRYWQDITVVTVIILLIIINIIQSIGNHLAARATK
ncbi:MAG: ABC transporter permease [Clostridia bacterium]|nr:ABC transporter permease [Clostridia bacterium]MBQ8972270.1 ABC transporter permease [Clostridia bacterium]